MSQHPSNLTPAERAAFLDQYTGQRITDAQALEARVDARLAFLEKTELGLRALHEAIRRQVAEAMPLLAGFSDRIQHAGDLTAVQGQAEAIKREAEDVVADAQLRLEVLNKGARDISGIVEAAVREAMAAVHDRVERAIAPAVRRLEERAERAERQTEQMVQSAEYALAARLGTFEASLTERCNALSRHHDALLAGMQRHATASVDAATAAIGHHLNQTADELRVHGRHLHAELQQHAAELKQELRERTLASRQSMEQTLQELLGCVDGMIDDASRAIGRRIVAAKPVELEVFVEGDAMPRMAHRPDADAQRRVEPFRSPKSA